MAKLISVLAACALAVLALSACSVGKTQTFKTISNGGFKIVIRSTEPINSGIHNIDICVLPTADTTFPPHYRKAQCFLQGYDLDGLTVQWLAPNYIKISIKDGWVSEFRNSATVSIKGSTIPASFHIWLYDQSAHPGG